MSAPATHACGACGGTGSVSAPSAPYRPSCTRDLCVVCRGGGRLPDRMPAADAMADAETLLIYLDKDLGVGRIMSGVSFEMTIHGWAARSKVLHALPPWKESEAVYRAKLAAHAAFHAVPGLRGDK